MEDFFELVLSLGILIGFSLLVAQMSKEKDIGFWTLFGCCLIFTPLVGLIIGLVAKRKQDNGGMYMPPTEQEGFLSRFMSKKKDNNEEKNQKDWKFRVDRPDDDIYQ